MSVTVTEQDDAMEANLGGCDGGQPALVRDRLAGNHQCISTPAHRLIDPELERAHPIAAEPERHHIVAFDIDPVMSELGANSSQTFEWSWSVEQSDTRERFVGRLKAPAGSQRRCAWLRRTTYMVAAHSIIAAAAGRHGKTPAARCRR